MIRLLMIAAVGVAWLMDGRVHAGGPQSEEPPGCFDIGVALRVSLFRADGITGVVGAASECETILAKVWLQKPQDIDTYCAFGGGMLSIVTPDGVSHLISSDVPCIGGNTGLWGCNDAINFIASALIPYTVSVDDRPEAGPCRSDADCDAASECRAGVCQGSLVFRATYEGGGTSLGGAVVPVGDRVSFGIAPVFLCGDGDQCTLDSCDPNVYGPAACMETPVVCQGPGTCEPPCSADCSVCNPGPNCGNAIQEPGEACDLGRAGNGAPWSCCTESCTARPSGETCRAAAGACDVAETCTGSSGDCPADVVAPPSQVCRESAGPCDQADRCDGVDPECPAIDAKIAGVVCREAVDACDVAEQCDGQNAECPALDQRAARGVRCGEGGRGFCDGAGMCLLTCGDDMIDEGEQCDGSARPEGQWCSADCRITACGWREVGTPALADLQTLVCSLSAPVTAEDATGSCVTTDKRVVSIEATRRGVVKKVKQAVDASDARRLRVLRRADGRLTKVARGIPFDECGQNTLSPAVLNWKRIIRKIMDALH